MSVATMFDDGHWFDHVLPWEEPSWLRPIQRLRWRRRHERIRDMEASLSTKWNWRDLPWENPCGGCA